MSKWKLAVGKRVLVADKVANPSHNKARFASTAPGLQQPVR